MKSNRVEGCVSLTCGRRYWMDVETDATRALKSRFPSFSVDGTGMMIGSGVRDVFFSIERRSAGRIRPYLSSRGFKCAVDVYAAD